MKRSKLQLSLAVALGLINAQVFALGLGQVEVRSRLSEPLVAEIPVIASAGEIDSLSVRLASADAFARVGLERPLSLVANLEFSVGRNVRGERVIRVTTTRPIDDPFLSFLIEAEWNGGRLVREFAVLLDPPYLAKAANVAVQAPSTPAPQVRQPAPPQPVPPATMEPTTPVASGAPIPAAPATASTRAAGDWFGPVRSGQTLSRIAQELRPAGVGLHQTMVALLRTNPDAFIDGNINLLKRGAILRIPGRSEIEAIDSAEAVALVREQTLAWQRTRAATLQPYDNVIAEDRRRQPRSSVEPDARLRIVPPAEAEDASATQSGASSTGDGARLQAELDRTREQLVTRDAEIKELRARVADLEKLNDDSDKLLRMKNSELAQLQQRLRELEAMQQAVRVAPAPNADGAGEAVAELAPSTTSGAPVGEVGKSEPAKPETAAPMAARPAAAKPAPMQAAPGAENAPWYRMPIAIAGGSVLLVGLLAWLLARRGRRTSPLESSLRHRSAASDLAASFQSVHTKGDTAVQSDADARRQELEASVSAHPEQLETHLALLRHLYAQGAVDAFEAAAAEMRAHVVDPHDPQWQEAVAMGSQLLPDSPLFGDELDDSADVIASDDAAIAVAEHEEPAPAPELHPEAPAGDRIDAAFARAVREFADAPAEPASAWEEPETIGSLPADAAAGDDEEVLEVVDTAPQPLLADVDDDAITSARIDAEANDPVATKLDLAQAYIDIGDLEAAEALLDEVKSEGNSEQQQRAAHLLAGLR